MEQKKEEIIVLDEGIDPEDGPKGICCKGPVTPLKI